MLIAEKNIVNFVKAKLNQKENDNKKENTTDNLSTSNTWMTLLDCAKNFTPPIFTKTDNLGNELLDIALVKATDMIVGQTGYSKQFVQHSLWIALRENRHCNKSAESTIKFIRDFDSDDFVLCPECEEENDNGWTKCTECGFDKTK